MLNVIVADMAASLDFCQRLGIAIPGEAAGGHVQLKMPGGFSLELGYGPAGPAVACRLASAARPAPGWSPGSCWPAGRRSMTGTPVLTAAGYRGRQPPFGGVS